VGNGILNADIDAQGYLMNWDTLVVNGVVSRYAYFAYFPGCCGELPPGPHFSSETVQVNGHPIETYTWHTGQGYTDSKGRHSVNGGGCLQIETKFIKFARRGGGNPGLNQISATISTDDEIAFIIPLVTAGAGNLSFKAMAPVVLLSGCCGEDYTFWNNPAFGAATLKTKFDSLKIPYDDGSKFTKGGLITGAIESGSITAAVHISLAARSFGAQWVHLVGHSKGGLWARDAFPLLEVGVLSFTTLDTPHEGSIGADVAEQDRQNAVFSDLPLAVRIALWRQQQVDAPFDTISDLTQSALAKFNSRRPSPPQTTRVGDLEKPLKLYALSSDANSDCSKATNGNRTISALEAAGMPSPSLASSLYEAMYNYVGTTMALDITLGQCSSSGHPVVNCVRGSPPPTSAPSCGDNHAFLLNDFIVTTDSQAYKSNQGTFLPLTNPSPDQYPSGGDNHNSVPNDRIAQLIASILMQISRQ